MDDSNVDNTISTRIKLNSSIPIGVKSIYSLLSLLPPLSSGEQEEEEEEGEGYQNIRHGQ